MSILVLTSDTLIGTPATGNIEYNGQFYGTDSNASRAQMQRLVLETAKVSTSGTTVDFTGIPAWVKRITVMFNNISTNSTNNYQLQLGDSGGIEITGYDSRSANIDGTNATSANTITTGFLLKTSVASASTYAGQAVIVNISGNLWVCSSNIAAANAISSFQNGTKTLSDTLTQLRIIGSATGSPSDTFDAGSINILYEG